MLPLSHWHFQTENVGRRRDILHVCCTYPLAGRDYHHSNEHRLFPLPTESPVGAGRDKGQNPLAKAAKDTPRAINLAINGYAAQCGCSLSVIESAESAYEFHHADILANKGASGTVKL